MDFEVKDMTLYEITENGYEPIFTLNSPQTIIGVDLSQNEDITAKTEAAFIFEPNREVTYNFVVINE